MLVLELFQERRSEELLCAHVRRVPWRYPEVPYEPKWPLRAAASFLPLPAPELMGQNLDTKTPA